jgi:hypothetical protein
MDRGLEKGPGRNVIYQDYGHYYSTILHAIGFAMRQDQLFWPQNPAGASLEGDPMRVLLLVAKAGGRFLFALKNPDLFEVDVAGEGLTSASGEWVEGKMSNIRGIVSAVFRAIHFILGLHWKRSGVRRAIGIRYNPY